MRAFYLLLLFFAFHLFSFTVFAKTYYLSPTGKNSNSGTSINTPWQSITKINGTTFNGDTILFQGGMTFTGNMGFTSSDKGTSTKPIVIGSYGSGRAIISSGNSYGVNIYNTAGFKIKNLIFQGSGRTINTQDGILVYMNKDSTILSYIKIDSVEVYGYRNSGILIGSWNKASGFDNVSITNSISHDNGKAGIFMYAQNSYVHKNVYVGYNKVYNNTGIANDTLTNTGNGIMLNGVNGAVIEFCTSYNNGELHSNTKGGPIGIWASASNNVIIQFNESHHNKTNNLRDGGGFDLDGGCTNSILQYNYSHDNTGPGFMAAQYSGALPMKNNIIRYNISENDVRKNSYGAIHIWAGTSSIVIQGLEIYNNTVYLDPGTNTYARAFYYQSGGISGVNVRNNIFQTTKAAQVVNTRTIGINFQGNDYWSTGTTFKIVWGTTTCSSLTSWRTATGQEKVNGIASGLQIDPKFLDTIRGVTFNDATKLSDLNTYQLKDSSGLINKGLNLAGLFGLNVGIRDFWGNNITNKASFNMGAYQGTTTTLNNKIDLPSEPAKDSETNIITFRAFPNPFKSNVEIGFALQNSAKINIILYNFEGKIVRSLFTGNLRAGEYKNFNLNVEGIANGGYIIRMTSEGKVLSQKIILKQ